VTGLRRRLRGDLDAIVTMAMRKDPRRRYSTVQQLGDDVRRYLAGLPVIARRNTAMYRAVTFTRRHRFALAGAVVAAVLITAMAGSFSRGGVEAEGTGRANTPRQTQRARDVERVQALRSEAALLASRNDWVGAERAHREALDIQRRVSGRVPADTGPLLADLARDLVEQGRYTDAESLQREAVALTRTMRGAKHPDTAAALAALGSILQAMGRDAEALNLYEEAFASSEEAPLQLGTENSPEVAASLEQQHEHEHIEGVARRILLMRGTTLPDTHPTISSTLHALGVSLCGRGSSAEGESHLRESLRLRLRNLPTHDVQIARSEMALAECLVKRGRFSDAEPLMLGGYARLRTTSGDSDEHTIDALERVVRLYETWDVPEVARRHRAELARLRQ
jgi:tetratricopeptide (TPR) repeat protein